MIELLRGLGFKVEEVKAFRIQGQEDLVSMLTSYNPFTPPKL